VAFLLFLFLAVLSGQAYPPGPQVLTFWSTADNSDQPYGIDTSDHFDLSKKYSLLIMLRGAYSSERLELCRVFGQGNRAQIGRPASRYFPMLHAGLHCGPLYARATWVILPKRMFYDVMADLKRCFATVSI